MHIVTIGVPRSSRPTKKRVSYEQDNICFPERQGVYPVRDLRRPVARGHRKQIVYAMADAGADLIELGIPFSDPTAEGPVIQEANVRALSAGNHNG